MEKLRKDSSAFSFEDQTNGTDPNSDLPSIKINEQRDKSIVESTKYQLGRESMLDSTPIGDVREKYYEARIRASSKQEARDRHELDGATVTKRRIIDLSDSNSKIALRRQLGMTDVKRGSFSLKDDATNYQDVEILRKLPPDTVVIRQETKSIRDDSDYARELTETNSSGGSSSTSGCAAAKVKRIPRTTRNKTRETIEVRRNPMRVSKKDIDKNFPRPRQRLLTDNSREVCSNYEFGKRSRLSTMPYMNTRSVTRKMYTVGATYQAPTRRDETEWREWPVHGMHERPVFHPQAGLAVEYLGRYFTCLDGLSYCEIIDEPEIEVVAVDPHCDQRPSSAEKKLRGKIKDRNQRSSNPNDIWSICLSEENKSFETCMHGSLHCVLGYCSQIMIPSYQRTVEDRTMKMAVPTAGIKFSEPAKRMMSSNNQNTNLSMITSVEKIDKFAEEAKLLEGYAIAMAQTVQNKTANNMTARKNVASTSRSSSMTYLSEAQKSTEIENLKTTAQTDRMKLKQILRGVPNSSLILLRSSGARTSGEICKTTTKVFNPTKLEETPISDETLMEISSICKKLVSNDESFSNHKRSPVRNSFYTLKRHAAITGEYTAKKILLENQLENMKIVNVAKDSNKNRNNSELKIGQLDGGMSMTNSNKSRVWCTSETSEIAKILSEYNRSTMKKSAIQNQTYGSDTRNIKVNLTNAEIKNGFWQKTDRILEENRNAFTDRNSEFDLPQRKWKRFHVTLEKPKNTQITSNNQNAWNNSSLSENRQIPLKDRQMNLSVLNYVKEKSFESRKDLNKQCEVVMIDANSEETTSGCSRDETGTSKAECLQELLENTAVLYCAATGVHQEDLSSYIDTLDRKQSVQWLDNWNNSVV